MNKEQFLDSPSATIQCLDKGFVRLVDYMGDDSRIVQAARVSYGKGTKTVREDKALIDYLIRNQHTSPLEQVVFTFHCKMPIFVARQWVRHRTARLNEISGRYSAMKEEFYVPDYSRFVKQSKNNKQGSDTELLENPIELEKLMVSEQTTSFAHYSSYLESGLAKELARINLPLSLYTEWYWQMDLHNLFHFIQLRLHSHAQYEIRVYAEALFELIKLVTPLACESFTEHNLHGCKLSRSQIELIKTSLNHNLLRELLEHQPPSTAEGLKSLFL